MTRRPDTKVEVILGVDTHLDFHTVVAVDHLGKRLGELSLPTTVIQNHHVEGFYWPTKNVLGMSSTESVKLLLCIASTRHGDRSAL